MNATRGPELKPQGFYVRSSVNRGTRSLHHGRLIVQWSLHKAPPQNQVDSSQDVM